MAYINTIYFIYRVLRWLLILIPPTIAIYIAVVGITLEWGMLWYAIKVIGTIALAFIIYGIIFLPLLGSGDNEGIIDYINIAFVLFLCFGMAVWSVSDRITPYEYKGKKTQVIQE